MNPAILYYGYFDFPISSRDPWYGDTRNRGGSTGYFRGTSGRAQQTRLLNRRRSTNRPWSPLAVSTVAYPFSLVRGPTSWEEFFFFSSLPHFQALAPQPNSEKCDNSLSPALLPYKVTWSICMYVQSPTRSRCSRSIRRGRNSRDKLRWPAW